MKKLPELYKNRVTTSTNKKYYYSEKTSQDQKTSSLEKTNVSSRSTSVREVLNQLFGKKVPTYTQEVTVTTRTKTFITRFVQERDGVILTIDNEKIPIEDILSLEIHSS